MTSNGYRPVREMALSISAGFSRMEMTGDEGIGARCGRGCLRGERGDFDSRAFSLQRVVAKQCITGFGCHDRVGIGAHRVDGIPIVTEGAMNCSARSARIRLQYSSPTRRIKTRVAGVTLNATLCILLRCSEPELLPGCSSLETQGNFNSRITAWKRGSWRIGSMSESVRRLSKPASRSRAAVSSHSRAFGLSPRCA